MPKLQWDADGSRFYEMGIDRGVLYVNDKGAYGKGVAWNGLTQFTESPSGAETTAKYADNIKYLTMYSAEDYNFTIQAFTYPDEFSECDGSAQPVKGLYLGQQPRKLFGFSCRTMVGNDQGGMNAGYKLHIVYGATASPSEKSFQTINNSPDAISFSWKCSTNPTAVSGYKPTAAVTIDSTKVDAGKLTKLEDILYGEKGDPKLPTIDQVIAIIKDGTVAGLTQ